jgi:chromosome segregation protein
MHLKRLELNGFKSFAKKSEFIFDVPIIAVVGPNGSGKSNVVEAIRFVLGEQSVKSMRGKVGSDLIFKGSKDVSAMSRAAVSIVFDNKDRVFELQQSDNSKIGIDFDEVTISREVFTDGINKYLINGHEVRMKDVHELIASVNIGSSGHHIISQGEADRYLNASIKDRRELIEEALGLKVYQYRIKESLRKLERSENNMRESELMRREIAPHLKFLKKQVEKIEKAKHLTEDLSLKYQAYFAQEDYLISTISRTLDSDRETLKIEYGDVQDFLKNHQDPSQTEIYPEQKYIQESQFELQSFSLKATNIHQEFGRIKGMISLLQQQEQDSLQKKSEPKTSKKLSFSLDTVTEFVSSVIKRIDTLPLLDNHTLIGEIQKLKTYIYSFTESQPTQEIDLVSFVDNSQQINDLNLDVEKIEQDLSAISSQEEEIKNKIESWQTQVEGYRVIERESQRKYYEHLSRKKELDSRRIILSGKDESLGIRLQSRSEEYTEACTLLGQREITFQKILTQHSLDVSSQTQEQFRREIERIKIRLEDMGGGSGGDIIREFDETLERDNFLGKEIEDIELTIISLRGIINDLKIRLNTEFDVGIEKINHQFDKFFKLMFGGGKAHLSSAKIKKRKKKLEDDENMQLDLLEDESDTIDEYGIDIDVQLPRKKVSDLDMLSGGERSLTSIALLFALSQVNPPPFLVLDETDAALDEANSQRYGDMVESLSKYSQLVVVTHNRETMSRAQTLFGVTLGRDDSSAVLSLRLEDASKYAK